MAKKFILQKAAILIYAIVFMLLSATTCMAYEYAVGGGSVDTGAWRDKSGIFD